MLNSANRGKEQIIFGLDSVVIKKYISGIEGGRTLDMTGFPLANVPSGCAAIKLSNGNYAPMPIKAVVEGEANTPVLNEDGSQKYAYDALPSGAKYVGVIYRTISASDPAASIMFDGVVNEALLPFGFDGIKAAFAAAVPHIIFATDEVA